MLLTSTQVSLATSSIIVVFFTTALFLAGYIIQQRTLRELRAAIRAPPHPSPVDRFMHDTTELPDGTVVRIFHNYQDKEDAHVQVRPAVPLDADAQPVVRSGRLQNEPPAPHDQVLTKQAYDRKTPQKPVSRAERRRLIREELQRLARAQERVSSRQRVR